MKSRAIIYYVVFLLAAFAVSGCKPDVVSTSSATTVQPGAGILIGSFSITAKSSDVVFNKIGEVSADAGIFRNIRIAGKDGDIAAPIDNFSFSIAAKKTAEFKIVADVVSADTIDAGIALNKFGFSQKPFNNAVTVDGRIDFKVRIKVLNSWERYSLATNRYKLWHDSDTLYESTPDFEAVAINNKGQALALAGLHYEIDCPPDDGKTCWYDDCPKCKQIYDTTIFMYEPGPGWKKVGSIIYQDTRGISYKRIFIDDDGNGLIFGTGTSDIYYTQLYARRIVGGSLDSETISVGELGGKNYYFESASNSSGDICIISYEDALKAVTAYKLSTHDNTVSVKGLDIGMWMTRSPCSPAVAVAENGDIAAVWYEANREIYYAMFFDNSKAPGVWSDKAAAIYRPDEGISSSSMAITSYGPDRFAFIWTEYDAMNPDNHEYKIYKRNISADEPLSPVEQVGSILDEIYIIAAASSGDNLAVTFSDSNKYLNSLNYTNSMWQQPVAISHTNLCSPVTSLHADDNGSFMAGYISSDDSREYLNAVIYDRDLGWLPNVRLSRDFYYCTYCYPKWDVLPIAMSGTGNAIAAWDDGHYTGLSVSLYK